MDEQRVREIVREELAKLTSRPRLKDSPRPKLEGERRVQRPNDTPELILLKSLNKAAQGMLKNPVIFPPSRTDRLWHRFLKFFKRIKDGLF